MYYGHPVVLLRESCAWTSYIGVLGLCCFPQFGKKAVLDNVPANFVLFQNGSFQANIIIIEVVVHWYAFPFACKENGSGDIWVGSSFD